MNLSSYSIFSQKGGFGFNSTSGMNSTEVALRTSLVNAWLRLNVVRGAAAFLSWCLLCLSALDGEQGNQDDAQIQTLERRKKELVAAADAP